MKSLLNRVVLVSSVIVVAGLGAACGSTTETTIPGGGGTTDGGGTASDGGGSSDTDGGGSAASDGGTSGTDAGSTSGAPTWTMIYGTYFAAGTPGHCGNSGCHLSTLKGFKCGSDKTTCYTGLVSAGYITPKSAAASPLADANQSCLTWLGGNMPPGGGSLPKAQTDLTAWANAGALNN